MSSTLFLDLSVFCALSSLQFGYAKIFRLRDANIVLRIPPRHHVAFEEWCVSQDSITVASSYVAQRHAAFYRTGPTLRPHPLDEIWAEHFQNDNSMDPEKSEILGQSGWPIGSPFSIQKLSGRYFQAE